MAENQVQPQSALTQEDKRNLNLAVLSENTNVMNPVEYAQIKKVAKDFWESNALAQSFKNEQQIVMAMLAGREMGMTFNEAVNDLYFVNGKLNVHGKATPAAVRRHHWRIKYVDETPVSCTARLINTKTGEEIEDTFTFAEAEQSGFTKDSSGRVKAGWIQGANRRRKLRYGVLSLIIHTYIPEVLGAAAGIGEYSQDYIEGETVIESTQFKASDDKKAAIIAAQQEDADTVIDTDITDDQLADNIDETIGGQATLIDEEPKKSTSYGDDPNKRPAKK